MNNEAFKLNKKELIRNHNPCLVSLLETKMTNHALLRDEFAFDDMFEVSAVGNSGGLVVMWYSHLLNVTRKQCIDQEIHAMIQVLPNSSPLFFSVVYARTCYSDRLKLWENLKNYSQTI